MHRSVLLRHAEASDFLSIITVLDSWWGGRHMSDMLPRLFFVHFRPTSFVAECNGNIVGFIVGFVSFLSAVNLFAIRCQIFTTTLGRDCGRITGKAETDSLPPIGRILGSRNKGCFMKWGKAKGGHRFVRTAADQKPRRAHRPSCRTES